MTTAEKLENYFTKDSSWKEGINTLRQLLLATKLKEDVKWNMPVYTIESRNVVGIASFKNHYGLWFYQGVFLKDPHHILQNAQEGKTKAMRHLKFEAVSEINKDIVSAYVQEAIENAREGKKIKIEKSVEKLVVPELLKNALLNNAQLELNFKALSLAKRREYANYIIEAKQEATKQKRLARCIPLILEGKPLTELWKS